MTATDVRIVEPVYTRVGAWVRQSRLKAGLTQEKLGFAIGLERSSVAAIEAGRQRVHLHTILAIEAAINPVPTRLTRVA